MMGRAQSPPPYIEEQHPSNRRQTSHEAWSGLEEEALSWGHFSPGVISKYSSARRIFSLTSVTLWPEVKGHCLYELKVMSSVTGAQQGSKSHSSLPRTRDRCNPSTSSPKTSVHPNTTLPACPHQDGLPPLIKGLPNVTLKRHLLEWRLNCITE